MYLTVLAALVAVWWPMAWIGVTGLVLAVTSVNHDFCRYFATHSGLRFTLRVVPLHWLYLGYCGFCVVWGTLLHALDGLGKSGTAG